jgi:hypothetical protein
MPIMKVKGGFRWGNHGKVYPTRAGAEKQAAAAHANGYRGDATSRHQINMDAPLNGGLDAPMGTTDAPSVLDFPIDGGDGSIEDWFTTPDLSRPISG